MKKSPLILLLLICATTLIAQEVTDNDADTLREHALNLYLEDVPDFIKKEVPFINYVRDKKDADLVVIVTMEDTGSGGAKFSLFLEGQNKFAWAKDTIEINVYPGQSEDERGNVLSDSSRWV